MLYFMSAWVLIIIGFFIGASRVESFYEESLADVKLEQCTIDKPSHTECKLYVTYKPVSVTKYMLAK